MKTMGLKIVVILLGAFDTVAIAMCFPENDTELLNEHKLIFGIMLREMKRTKNYAPEFVSFIEDEGACENISSSSSGSCREDENNPAFDYMNGSEDSTDSGASRESQYVPNENREQNEAIEKENNVKIEKFVTGDLFRMFLDNLEELDLSDTLQMAKLPFRTINSMASLKKLKISFNFGIKIEWNDWHFKNIEEIEAENCSLNYIDMVNILYHCPELKVLNFKSNSLKETDIQTPCNSKSIERLILSDCEISLEVLIAISRMALTSLDISNNSISTFDTSHIWDTLKNTLMDLNLQNCEIDALFLNQIQSLRLTRLVLSENSFHNSEINFGLLENTLNRLEMNNCDLSSIELNGISRLKLKELLISNNDLSNCESLFYSMIDSLVILDVGCCNINDQSTHLISNLQKIEKLNLSENNLTEIGHLLDSLPNKSLKSLGLSACEIGQRDLYSISTFELEELDISNTNLSLITELPDFTILKTSLKDLDISDTFLSYLL